MRGFRFALAVLAAVGVVLEPVAPSFAATASDPAVYQSAAMGQSPADGQEIARQAASGNAAILSAKQMNSLAASNPALYAKLMSAYRGNTMPNLTPDEKKLMRQMTARNLTQFKAGIIQHVATTGGTALTAAAWFIFGFMGVVFLLILGAWSSPTWFCKQSGLGWLSGACK